MRERIYLLSLISLIFLVCGCGEEYDPDTEIAPKVINVNVNEGGIVASNWIFSVTFSKEMKSAKISISDYENADTILDGDTATWHPLPHKVACGDKTIDVVESMPPGIHTLTVTGIDKYGNELEEFTPISFRATAPD